MNSLEMLAHIAKGLGPLKDKVVFVGGSTVSLYLTDPGASPVRPTEDVDCVIQVLTRGQYYKLEAELERLAFAMLQRKMRLSAAGATKGLPPI